MPTLPDNKFIEAVVSIWLAFEEISGRVNNWSVSLTAHQTCYRLLVKTNSPYRCSPNELLLQTYYSAYQLVRLACTTSTPKRSMNHMLSHADVQFQALPHQMTWTQGEDELVAAGLLRHGMNFDLISQDLLPIRTPKEIQARQRNRCHRVEGNCIRVCTCLSHPADVEHVMSTSYVKQYSLLLNTMSAAFKRSIVNRNVVRSVGQGYAATSA